VETGSGKTTLLFSHLSADHLVFAVDDGESITKVKQSPLLNAARVTYVEGPTQLTLPQYRFRTPFQMVLIDGPHGYPFPDMEYYYFYPRIAGGGLLLIDDIQIPTIGRMFEIIRAGDMFELLEIVDDNLAFFRRTDASLIDPCSDSWWLQGYNRPYYERWINPAPTPAETPSGGGKGLFRAAARLIPAPVNRLIPRSLRSWLRRRL
jgi:hypothetical protein